jgi:hypothetical protein
MIAGRTGRLLGFLVLVALCAVLMLALAGCEGDGFLP